MPDNIIRESANCFLFARCLLKLLATAVSNITFEFKMAVLLWKPEMRERDVASRRTLDVVRTIVCLNVTR